MKNQKIELNKENDIFEADITVINTNKLMQMIPNLELYNLANEFIVRKHKKYLELIPFDD